MNIERIADDLTNGNLTDAKKQARKVSYHRLIAEFNQVGWDKRKATAAAAYLKNPGNETFRAFCDADKPEPVEQVGNIPAKYVRALRLVEEIAANRKDAIWQPEWFDLRDRALAIVQGGAL